MQPILSDYQRIALRRLKIIVLISAIFTLLVFVASFLLPPHYYSQAIIVPLRSKNDGFSFLETLSGGRENNFNVEANGLVITGEQLMALLRSRTMAERIIKKYSLSRIINKERESKSLDALVDSLLKDHMEFLYTEAGKLIVISSFFDDPRVAADVVSGYIDELQAAVTKEDLRIKKAAMDSIRIVLGDQAVELLKVGKQLGNVFADKSIEIPKTVYWGYLDYYKNLLGQYHLQLAAKHEMSKKTTGIDVPAFMVIDPPRIAVEKYWPERGYLVLKTFILSFFLVAIYMIIASGISSAKKCNIKKHYPE